MYHIPHYNLLSMVITMIVNDGGDVHLDNRMSHTESCALERLKVLALDWHQRRADQSAPLQHLPGGTDLVIGAAAGAAAGALTTPLGRCRCK
jgi:hypothetical protein